MTEPNILREDVSGVFKWVYYDDDNPSGKALDAQAAHASSHESGGADEIDANGLFTRCVVLKVIADDTALATGDGKCYFTVPIELNGYNLVSVGAHVYTVSSSGTPIVQLHNLTDTADMLSTRITIDANEKDSKDATAAAVIDTDHDDVATGDEIRIDVDGAGTGTKGLEVRMGFRKP